MVPASWAKSSSLTSTRLPCGTLGGVASDEAASDGAASSAGCSGAAGPWHSCSVRGDGCVLEEPPSVDVSTLASLASPLNLTTPGPPMSPCSGWGEFTTRSQTSVLFSLTHLAIHLAKYRPPAMTPATTPAAHVATSAWAPTPQHPTEAQPTTMAAREGVISLRPRSRSLTGSTGGSSPREMCASGSISRTSSTSVGGTDGKYLGPASLISRFSRRLLVSHMFMLSTTTCTYTGTLSATYWTRSISFKSSFFLSSSLVLSKGFSMARFWRA
mmetsp:Transcript_37007/g.104397  ORF Transcript_37007/g.104397 Transcript_37007/m.104397 type:complete len:271 (-) Transcript_37007:1184-1996(-)